MRSMQATLTLTDRNYTHKLLSPLLKLVLLFTVPAILEVTTIVPLYKESEVLHNVVKMYTITAEWWNIQAALESTTLNLLLWNGEVGFMGLPPLQAADMLLERLRNNIILPLADLRDKRFGNLTKDFVYWNTDFRICNAIMSEDPKLYASCGEGSSKIWATNLPEHFRALHSTFKTLTSKYRHSSGSLQSSRALLLDSDLLGFIGYNSKCKSVLDDGLSSDLYRVIIDLVGSTFQNMFQNKLANKQLNVSQQFYLKFFGVVYLLILPLYFIFFIRPMIRKFKYCFYILRLIPLELIRNNNLLCNYLKKTFTAA